MSRDIVYLRGILEFSNHCVKSCAYCGIGSDCGAVNRYRIPPQELIAAAADGHRIGLRSFVLQAGEDPGYSLDDLCRAISGIKALGEDPAVTLSVGVLDRSDYQRLFDAGADRFLLRFETADRELFNRIHPDDDLDRRLEALEDLRQIGYEVGTGFLVGIPGERPDADQANLDLLAGLSPHMVGLGPFIPAPGTVLGAEADPSGAPTLDRLLGIYAEVRRRLPKINLAAATALDSLEPDGRLRALDSGANVYMPNLTPMKYRENYKLYSKKTSADNTDNLRETLEAKLRNCGRTPGWGLRGNSPAYEGVSE